MSSWLVAVGAIGVHLHSLADNDETLHANIGVQRCLSVDENGFLPAIPVSGGVCDNGVSGAFCAAGCPIPTSR